VEEQNRSTKRKWQIKITEEEKEVEHSVVIDIPKKQTKLFFQNNFKRTSNPQVLGN